jgi:hypothetical protein
MKKFLLFFILLFCIFWKSFADETFNHFWEYYKLYEEWESSYNYNINYDYSITITAFEKLLKYIQMMNMM